MRTRDVLALIVAGSISAAATGQAPAGEPANEPKAATVEQLDPVDVIKLRKDLEANDAKVRAAAARAARELPALPPQPNVQFGLAGDQLIFTGVQAVMEKAAFLGVGVSPVTAALREQLKLPKYLGLVVDHVEEGSPAEQAGVKQYDILEKVDDQLLANAHQLAALVRSHKVGDEIKVTLIRQGQRQTVAAKLVERELAALDDAAPWGRPADAWVDDGGRGAGMVGAQRFVRAIGPEGHMAINLAPAGLPFPGGQQQWVLNDNNINMTVRTTGDGTRRLTATDVKTGKELFDGPIDTEEQRKGLPREVGDMLKQMDQMEIGQVPGGGGRFEVALTPQIATVAQVVPAEVPGVASMTYTDGDEAYEITSRKEGDGRKLELVFKLKGTVIFEGPINTAEERKALPKDVTQKLKTFPLKAMLDTLRFGGNARANPVGPVRVPGEVKPAPGR